MVLLPPSTAKVCPVMNDAPSEARNAMVSATSLTSPTRPMACVVLLCSKNFSYLSKWHKYHGTRLSNSFCLRFVAHASSLVDLRDDDTGVDRVHADALGRQLESGSPVKGYFLNP